MVIMSHRMDKAKTKKHWQRCKEVQSRNILQFKERHNLTQKSQRSYEFIKTTQNPRNL